jgi:hypothetical protein
MWMYSRGALITGLDVTAELTVLEGAAELGCGSRGHGGHEDGASGEKSGDELHIGGRYRTEVVESSVEVGRLYVGMRVVTSLEGEWKLCLERAI